MFQRIAGLSGLAHSESAGCTPESLHLVSRELFRIVAARCMPEADRTESEQHNKLRIWLL